MRDRRLLLVHAFFALLAQHIDLTVAFHVTSSPRVTEQPHRPMHLSQRRLFGVALKLASKPPENEEAVEEEESVFPNWIQALSRWPLFGVDESEAEVKFNGEQQLEITEDSNFFQTIRQWPLIPSGDIDDTMEEVEEAEEESDGGESFFSPLASLLNLEALLSLVKDDDESISSNEEKAMQELNNETGVIFPIPVLNLTRLEEISGWGKWIGGLRDSVTSLSRADGLAFTKSAEGVLRQATSLVESLIADASSAVSPMTIRRLIVRASRVVQNTASAIETAKQIAAENGLNVTEAAERARQTSAFASSLARVADGVVRKGYVTGDLIPGRQTLLDDVPAVDGSRALFDEFESALEIDKYGAEIVKGAEMGALSGAIYEDTIPRLRSLGQTIVAQGVSENVRWMVTDSVCNETSFKGESGSTDPFLVRTITLRGFDASDDTVDREELLTQICTATAEKLNGRGLLVHSGLLNIARAIYQDVAQYIDWMAPQHRLVLNGHSVGGSISILLLFLITLDRGPEFVRTNVLRVFSFGSPPVVCHSKSSKKAKGTQSCSILEALDLPSDMVHGFVQPWDPIVRLFSEKDALYPLVGDVGDDGVTVWVNGPPRTLRPLIKPIIESWNGWPRFRDTFRDTVLQNFTNVGTQHILLPEPTRYLSDRFLSVQVPVPQVETVIQLSARDLLPALSVSFPLDVFEVSFVPQAIRSFVHHFYPAYGLPIVDYVNALEQRSKGEAVVRAPVEDIVMHEEEVALEKIGESNGFKIPL